MEGRLEPLDCLLGMGDNTASMGWLRRTNFRESDENDMEWLVKQQVARKLASIVLEADCCIYRQWFKGEENVLADSLSRDGFVFTNQAHKSFLQSTIPQQVPPNFNISPLPNEIVSFISSTLLQLPVKAQRLMPRKESELVRSRPGLVSYLVLGSRLSSSKASPSSRETSSCLPSPRQFEKAPSLEEIKSNWWREQSTPPSHMWHRPSGQTIGLTPDWTSTVRRASSSKSNSEDIAIKMASEESRRQSQ